jgi:quercetin dioxygenase-like cupin family protein
VGPPVDGKYDGPNCFAGYGSRAHEPAQTTAQAIAEAKQLPPGPGRRYVYDMHAPHESITPGTASAVLTPGSALRLPDGVTGQLLTGELLHVAVLKLAPGATLGPHAHDNEQLTFVVEGAIEARITDDAMEVREHCLLHVPAGALHAIAAPHGATLVIAQDRRCAFAA